MHTQLHSLPHLAVVACHPFAAPDECYLRLAPDGALVCEADPTNATSFASRREARCAALHLPGSLRA